MKRLEAGVSLNLGGGAARGLAHVGVIRALHEAGFPFDSIAGVSMGAVIGAVYAVEPDVDFLEERITGMVKSEAFRESLLGSWHDKFNRGPRSFLHRLENITTRTGVAGRFFLSPGLLAVSDIEEIMFSVLPDIRMETTKIPFSTVAVSLDRGDVRVFQGKDSLREGVVASAAMPILFPPRMIDGELYTDGGVLDLMAIEATMKTKPGFILAVDVSMPGGLATGRGIDSALEVMLRTEEISSHHRNLIQLKMADFVIAPIVEEIHWANFFEPERIIRMGYEQAKARLPQLIQEFNQHRVSPVRKLFSFFRKKKAMRSFQQS